MKLTLKTLNIPNISEEQWINMSLEEKTSLWLKINKINKWKETNGQLQKKILYGVLSNGPYFTNDFFMFFIDKSMSDKLKFYEEEIKRLNLPAIKKKDELVIKKGKNTHVYNNYREIKEELAESKIKYKTLKRAAQLIKKHGKDFKNREYLWYDSWEGEKAIYPFYAQLKKLGYSLEGLC